MHKLIGVVCGILGLASMLLTTTDAAAQQATPPALRIGWAQTDITPDKPVLVAGQFPARISEKIRDPLTATVLVLQSGDEQAVMVSCDLLKISDELRNAVRSRVQRLQPQIDPLKVIRNATHTHTAPEIGMSDRDADLSSVGMSGIDLGEMPIMEYVEFAADRIAGAVVQAWNARATGGVAYGLGYAVLGRNRRWIDNNGVATMYQLHESSAPRFSHIEGYEDHSVNLLATYDTAGVLTGIVFNAACPSQETGSLFEISADFWHEARQELRARFGEKLFILPQVSAAGDLTSHRLYERVADNRMLKLKGRTGRQELARRIADSVADILPHLPPTIETAPTLQHKVETVELPLNALTEAHVEEARQEATRHQKQYETELQKLRDDPSLRTQPRWYVPVSLAYRSRNRHQRVIERYELLKTRSTFPTEVHVLRLGEIAFATNPFEYYLDFGIQIKVKSPALQTFLVQLTGLGTYVPSRRSIEGGGYGSTPASNLIGPEGGQVLADETVRLIRSLWPKQD